MKKNNLVGQSFGRLTVTGEYGRCKKSNVLWACTCTCGGTAIAYAYDLRNGQVSSCGCKAREGLAIKHGHARKGKKRNPTYSIWAAMMQRCHNPKDANYKHYGGRGIVVCERWHNFLLFYADMGDRPMGQSLERTDNNLGYSPENCRWATVSEQSVNKRSTVWVLLDGENMPVTHALKRLGYGPSSLHYYMKKLNTTHQGVIDLWRQQKKSL